LGNDFVFAVGQFARGIQAFEFGGDGFGAGIAVFLKGQSFTAQTGQGVGQASKCFGLALGVTGIQGRAEAHELIQHLGGGNAQTGLVQSAGVGGRQDVGGKFGFGGQVLQPLTLAKPILVAALFPLGEIVGLEIFAMLTQPLDDVRVGYAVENPVVDLVADDFWQAGDFAIAPVLKVRGTLSSGGGRDGGGIEVEDLGAWIHRIGMVKWRVRH